MIHALMMTSGQQKTWEAEALGIIRELQIDYYILYGRRILAMVLFVFHTYSPIMANIDRTAANQ